MPHDGMMRTLSGNSCWRATRRSSRRATASASIFTGVKIVAWSVHVQLPLHAAVDLPQGGDELAGAVARLAGADDDAALHVHRRIECRHAVALVSCVIVAAANTHENGAVRNAADVFF
jgi:hypothetical protein